MAESSGEKQGWMSSMAILAVNCLVWAAALVAGVVRLSKTGQAAKMYPVLASGSAVSIVARSMALRFKRRAEKCE